SPSAVTSGSSAVGVPRRCPPRSYRTTTPRPPRPVSTSAGRRPDPPMGCPPAVLAGYPLTPSRHLSSVQPNHVHLVVAHLFFSAREGFPIALGVHHPAPGGRVQGRIQERLELGAQLRVGHPDLRLDAAVRVAVHHVGAADPVLVDADEVEYP